MFKTLEISKEIKEKLMTPFPSEVLKVKPGKNGATYVSGSAVIDKLNATFGYAGWEWAIKKSWIEESVNKVTTVQWENNKKVNLPKDKWIIEEQLPVCHIIGELTVHFERADGSIHSVRKEAPGAQPIVAGQSNQENCYKGAHTDALKKAATMFGIALELYRKDEGDHIYFSDINYEDPWTDEMNKKYEKEITYVYETFENNGYTSENIQEVVLYVTNNIEYEVMPSNIVKVYDYLVGLEEENSESEGGKGGN